MNWKTIVPLVVALGLGVVAAKIGKDMMARGRQQGEVKTIKVAAAKEDLTPGAMIKEIDVVLRELPAASVASNSFANLGDVVGRVVTSQVNKGQPVLETMLAPKGALGGAQAMVPEGMRAVSLEVNEFSGVAGLLTPGSHVDIVQTIRGKDDASAMAKTIVENLTVIAVGRRMSTAAPVAGPGGEVEGQISRSVTLLATAEQAEAIDLASHTGSPRLVLRNGRDGTVTGGKGVTVAELRGNPDAAAAETQGSKPEAVETTRTEPTKPEPVKAPADYREVEVIRAGASTSVRVSVPAGDAVAGTHEKLLGTLPKD
jgi:pilus assembly protein CpaB